MACLLHEKPFAGINGSGKHVNWSLGNAHAGQPARSGRHAARQRAVPGVLRGRDSRRAQVLRACCGPWWPRPATTIAWAPTKPRRRSSRSSSATSSPTCSSRSRRAAPSRRKAKGTLTVGVDVLPPLPKDAGDRNRTSPFAFTGNRFEFRAVGASQSIAGPLVAMNTIVAESLDYCRHASSKRPPAATPAKLNARRAEAAAPRSSPSTSAIIFNGDGYSEAWHEEAEKRGLPNLKTSRRRPAGARRAGGRRSCSRSTTCSRERELAEPATRSTSSSTCKTVNIEAQARRSRWPRR